MKTNKFIVPLILIIIVFASACGPRKSSTPASDDGFLAAYQKFTDAVKHKSFAELKTLIEPSTGLFVIESPGALPVVYNLPDVEAFVSQNGKTLFDFFNDKISQVPVSEDMPVVDCKNSNGTPYSKAGCFMKDISSSNSSELAFLSSVEGNGSDKQKAETAKKTLNMKVINSYNHVYYFTKSGEKWYLTFIDMRTPCEA
jgi:hypothetical protein